MYAICWPTARFYLIWVESPEFQLLLEKRTTHVSWIVQFSSSKSMTENEITHLKQNPLVYIYVFPFIFKIFLSRSWIINWINWTSGPQTPKVFVLKLFKLKMPRLRRISLRHSNYGITNLWLNAFSIKDSHFGLSRPVKTNSWTLPSMQRD